MISTESYWVWGGQQSSSMRVVSNLFLEENIGTTISKQKISDEAIKRRTWIEVGITRLRWL